jgi:hypothetical protein
MKEKFVTLQPWIGLVSRVVLGGVLFAAGYLKAIAPDKSQMAVRAYDILPISFHQKQFTLYCPN